MSGKLIKEYLLTSVFLVLLTLGSLLPFTVLRFLCEALTIALFGYTATKFHYGYVACAGALIVATLLLMAQDLILAVYLALPIVLCGLTLGICKNLSRSPLAALSGMTVIRTLSMTASVKLAGTAENGQNIFEEALLESGEMYKTALSTAYGTTLSETEINGIISETISAVTALIPSAMILFSIAISVLCFYLFKRICMMKKEDVSMLLPFSEWRAERGIGILFFLLLLLELFLPENTLIRAALLNVSVVVVFVFYLFGLSMLEHILKKRVEKSFTRKLILIGVSFVAFLMFGLPFFGIAIMGAADAILDLRQRKENR